VFSIGVCSSGEGAPVATRDVFSEDELAQLRRFPEPARAELIRYFTLAPADEVFARKFRGRDNVLGAAVQLCTLPWLGVRPGRRVRRSGRRGGAAVGEAVPWLLRSEGTSHDVADGQAGAHDTPR
jgi:hypothetical protein